MKPLARATLLSLLLVAMMACAGDANVAPATTGGATPVATAIPILPSEATLAITASFKDDTNSFGRVTGQLLDITVTTNAPTSFNAWVTVAVPPGETRGSDEITVGPGWMSSPSTNFQFSYSTKGTYLITVWTVDPGHQQDGFQHWVGEFGEKLDGNPLVFHNPEWPGVLELRSTLTVTN